MEEIIFEKKSSADESNRRILNKLKAAEKYCSPFQLECSEVNGVWGIWLKEGDDCFLVNPIELTSSIYKDDYYYFINVPKDTVKAAKKGRTFQVDIRNDNQVFEWHFENSAKAPKGRLYFTYDEYLSKIIKAVTELRDVWKEGKKIAYDKFDAQLDGVEMCLQQLNLKHTLPSHNRLMAKDVKLETFRFVPSQNEYCEGYTIGIGKRTYDTFFTHWDSNFEYIRYQLERIAFDKKATVELPFDMSTTVLKLQKTSVLKQINESGDGIGYKYKRYMLVEIEPNEFVHMPILKGYCDEKKTVQTFYEGLLQLALLHPKKAKGIFTDTPSKLVAYNMFKSPIIESYLRNDNYDIKKYAVRQVHVKHILRIEPDYDAIMFDENEVAYGMEDIYDKKGNPINLRALESWAKEMRPIIDASAKGENCKKDWANYHRRGIELANKLREKLSTDFDLWYAAPFEDKSGTIPKPMLII